MPSSGKSSRGSQSKSPSSEPVRDLESLTQINLNAAGLDIGASEIFVCVPSCDQRRSRHDPGKERARVSNHSYRLDSPSLHRVLGALPYDRDDRGVGVGAAADDDFGGGGVRGGGRARGDGGGEDPRLLHYRLSSKVEWIRNVANTNLSKPRLLELIQALVTDNPGSALIMGENPRNGSSCGIFLHWASRRLGCCQIVGGAWDDKDSERRRWGLHAASRCLLLAVPIASLLHYIIEQDRDALKIASDNNGLPLHTAFEWKAPRTVVQKLIDIYPEGLYQ
jgi:hypothetical protein